MVPLRLWGLLLLGLGSIAHAADNGLDKETNKEANKADDASVSSASASESETTSTSTSSESSGIIILTGTHETTSQKTPKPTLPPTTVTLATTTLTGVESATDNATDTETKPPGTATVTYLSGSMTITSTVTDARSGNFSTTASATSTAPTVTNTQPCNNYVELCNRKYSNITNVGCHNSPFTRPGNAASNQALSVTQQLDDGVRFLQGQMHWNGNDTVPHFCHTTCDILDAGRITDWLVDVKNWVAANRFEVVTLLLENGNYSTPDLYVPYINQTGILDYVYTPPYQPMNITTWPTLAEMIIYNTRVVIFIDYMANQTAYPWWIDEFSNMWETPFDPTDQAFPCTIQRPDGLTVDQGKGMLYLANHNLNAEVSILGTSILVPDVSNLNLTNNVTGYGSLGMAANNCRSTYDRPPTVLNVDYYNFGGDEDSGAVFQVAAAMNNVTYRGGCCGKAATSDAAPRQGPGPMFWYEMQKNDRRSVAVFLLVWCTWMSLVW
ncbi:hypothetical protein VSDG_04333 [Cytospora chrysosperma]|uniref:Phosphatidylinositol-specific phospholipase C X domain-containing protein n=1 Tax=Cytospora chrysosperma TaxID=252740 RepID=A0A423W5H7_CYTCH|nr:hypothetical protein VSDG_04333 [Valsa sordida]